MSGVKKTPHHHRDDAAFISLIGHHGSAGRKDIS
jgi:hypothetical protein